VSPSATWSRRENASRQQPSVPQRPCEGVPSTAPNGVEFEKHDHHHDQDVHDSGDPSPRCAAARRTTPVRPIASCCGCLRGCRTRHPGRRPAVERGLLVPEWVGESSPLAAIVTHAMGRKEDDCVRTETECSDVSLVGLYMSGSSALEGRSGSCAVHHSIGTIRIARSNELRSSDSASCAIATRLSRSHSSSTGPLA